MSQRAEENRGRMVSHCFSLLKVMRMRAGVIH